jgi:nucleoside-diphosphate-sugar epimerase
VEKAYLLTGATGFLGSELMRSLSLDVTVHTLGRSEKNGIICDLANEVPELKSGYQAVIHNAGKAHMVARNSSEENDFFRVNYQGTLNLLSALEMPGVLPESLVFISSVAVYGAESGSLLDEESPLNASDPYGLSKIKAEEAVLAWGERHKVKIAILRLPLVAGPKAPGNLEKMLRALKAGYYFQIGKGEARRSMVSARDVAAVIHKVTNVGGVYNLTDRYHPSFAELGFLFSKKISSGRPYSLPVWFAKVLAGTGDIAGKIIGRSLPFNRQAFIKMSSSLTFSDDKAKRLLNWQPQQVLQYYKDLPETDFVYD